MKLKRQADSADGRSGWRSRLFTALYPVAFIVLGVILIAVFKKTLSTAYLFPIYPDEIIVRMWLSRTVFDFPNRINVYPACISHFIHRLPVTWFIPGVIEWGIHGNLESVSALRKIGVGFYIGTILLLTLPFMKAFPAAQGQRAWVAVTERWMVSLSIVIITLGIGVIPIFMVTNRQEQLIFPCLIGILLIVTRLNRQPVSRKAAWWLAGLFLLCVSMILYAHPKGLFLYPVFALAGLRVFRELHSRPLALLGQAIILLHAVLAYRAWTYEIACSDNLAVHNTLGSFAISPLTLWRQPALFFQQLVDSVVAFPGLVERLFFRANTVPDINYLPPISLGTTDKLANILIFFLFTAILLYTLVALCLRLSKTWPRTGGTDTLLAMLFLCVMGGALVNLTKGWYDSGYFYVMLSITFLFTLATSPSLPRLLERRRGPFILLLGCAVVSILSQSLFSRNFAGHFKSGYTGPGIPIEGYNRKKQATDLAAAAQACHIDPVKSRGVVVDDYTYMFYRHSRYPMPLTYLGGMGIDWKQIRQVLSPQHSAGIVVRCTYMNFIPSFAPYVIQRGDICCIPQESLDKLPIPWDGSGK